MMLLRYLIQWWIFRRVRVKAARQAYLEAKAALELARTRHDTRAVHSATERLVQTMHNLMKAEQACQAKWGRA